MAQRLEQNARVASGKPDLVLMKWPVHGRPPGSVGERVGVEHGAVRLRKAKGSQRLGQGPPLRQGCRGKREDLALAFGGIEPQERQTLELRLKSFPTCPTL